MEEEVFQDVSLNLIGDPPELVRPFNELHLTSMEEIGMGFARRGQHEMASKLYRLWELRCTSHDSFALDGQLEC